MAKKKYVLVTHINPDFDAICASWRMMRHLEKQGHTVEFAFVPAGQTLNGMKVDSDPRAIHIDTGRGKFDHHQEASRQACATLLVTKALEEDKDPTLQHILYMALKSDQGSWKGFSSLPHLVRARNHSYPPEEVVWMTFRDLEDLLQMEQGRVGAEEEFSEKAKWAQTRWGWVCVYEAPANLISSYRSQAMQHPDHPAAVTISREPDTGYVQVSSWGPDGKKQVDLTKIANFIIRREYHTRGLPPVGDYYGKTSGNAPGLAWFLHESRGFLACGTAKAPLPPEQVTKLTLEEITEVVVGVMSGKC